MSGSILSSYQEGKNIWTFLGSNPGHQRENITSSCFVHYASAWALGVLIMGRVYFRSQQTRAGTSSEFFGFGPHRPLRFWSGLGLRILGFRAQNSLSLCTFCLIMGYSALSGLLENWALSGLSENWARAFFGLWTYVDRAQHWAWVYRLGPRLVQALLQTLTSVPSVGMKSS